MLQLRLVTEALAPVQVPKGKDGKFKTKARKLPKETLSALADKVKD